jgi:hypothetical protein
MMIFDEAKPFQGAFSYYCSEVYENGGKLYKIPRMLKSPTVSPVA